MFNRPDQLRARGIRFAGDSLVSPLADDDIPTLPLRPSLAPETSHDAPDNATSKVLETSPSCSLLA